MKPDLVPLACAVVEAYDDALAVCCPRCEKEPEGAIWINTPANPNGVALSTTVEALRAALWGGA